MFAQYLRSEADSLIRIQCSIGIYIQCKFIEISNLTNTGILYDHVYTVNRCVDRINCDHADRHVVSLTFISTDVTTATGDRKLHSQSAVLASVKSSNDLIWIHDFDILICLDVSCCYNT